MKITEGKLEAKNLKVAVIVSRFNSMITTRLLSGAADTFTRLGGSEEDLTVVRVPGSFETVLAAKKIAESKKYDAVVCLSAIIRGETPHFDFIAEHTTKGLAEVMTRVSIPVSYGVITTDSLDQAIARAGAKQGNKGESAMMAAVEMANLMKQI